MKDVKDLSKEELKVMAYDLMVQIESLRQQLMAVNQMIAEKPKE